MAPTTFTSLADARVAPADARRSLLMIDNEGPGTLHLVLAGPPTVANTTTNSGIRIPANGHFVLRGDEYLGEVRGIFAAAGTARVTVCTQFT